MAALATIFVLIGAGTGAAVWMVLSNTLDYEVIVEGNAISLVEISAPTNPIARGANHTFHIQATVNAGTWRCNFEVNVTSQLITDDTLMQNVTGYLNDTWMGSIWSSSDPNTYVFDDILGTYSTGEIIDIFWTINFDFAMPEGAYSLTFYIIGEGT